MARPYEIRIKVTGEGAPQVKMIQRDLEAMKRSAAGVDKKMAAGNKQTKALGRNMKVAGGHARTMGMHMKKAMGYLGIGMAGFMLYGQLKEASRAAMEFESSLANVNSLLGKSHPMYGQYREDILALKKEVPVLELQDMSAALYEAISAGHDAGTVMEYMNATSAAAAGGWTDMATVVKGTNKVMAAYGMETKDAIKATDIGLKTVEKANLNYAEYADKIGMVVGSAATAKVSIEELHAAIAAASLIQRPEQVFTGLRGAMLDLPKKRKELKELGIEYTTFGDTLRQIKEADFGPEDWQALGMEREGAETLKAIILQYDTFTDTLQELGDVAGTTMEKLADRTQTAEWAMAKFSARVETAKIKVGQDLNVALAENLTLMGAFSDRLTEIHPKLGKMVDKFSVWDLTLLGMTSHWRLAMEAGAKFGDWLIKEIPTVETAARGYERIVNAMSRIPGLGGLASKEKKPKGEPAKPAGTRDVGEVAPTTIPEGKPGMKSGGTSVHIDKVEINTDKIDEKSFLRMVGKMVEEEAPA